MIPRELKVHYTQALCEKWSHKPAWIFSGGGVRGFSHCAALMELERILTTLQRLNTTSPPTTKHKNSDTDDLYRHVRLCRGASVGSIIAIMVAIGMTPNSILEAFSRINFEFMENILSSEHLFSDYMTQSNTNHHHHHYGATSRHTEYSAKKNNTHSNNDRNSNFATHSNAVYRFDGMDYIGQDPDDIDSNDSSSDSINSDIVYSDYDEDDNFNTSEEDDDNDSGGDGGGGNKQYHHDDHDSHTNHPKHNQTEKTESRFENVIRYGTDNVDIQTLLRENELFGILSNRVIQDFTRNILSDIGIDPEITFQELRAFTGEIEYQCTTACFRQCVDHIVPTSSNDQNEEIECNFEEEEEDDDGDVVDLQRGDQDNDEIQTKITSHRETIRALSDALTKDSIPPIIPPTLHYKYIDKFSDKQEECSGNVDSPIINMFSSTYTTLDPPPNTFSHTHKINHNRRNNGVNVSRKPSDLYRIRNIGSEIVVFSAQTHPFMKVADAIAKSICVPGICKPLMYMGDFYYDPGCIDNYPIDDLDIQDVLCFRLCDTQDTLLRRYQSDIFQYLYTREQWRTLFNDVSSISTQANNSNQQRNSENTNTHNDDDDDDCTDRINYLHKPETTVNKDQNIDVVNTTLCSPKNNIDTLVCIDVKENDIGNNHHDGVLPVDTPKHKQTRHYDDNVIVDSTIPSSNEYYINDTGTYILRSPPPIQLSSVSERVKELIFSNFSITSILDTLKNIVRTFTIFVRSIARRTCNHRLNDLTLCQRLESILDIQTDPDIFSFNFTLDERGQQNLLYTGSKSIDEQIIHYCRYHLSLDYLSRTTTRLSKENNNNK